MRVSPKIFSLEPISLPQVAPRTRRGVAVEAVSAHTLTYPRYISFNEASLRPALDLHHPKIYASASQLACPVLSIHFNGSDVTKSVSNEPEVSFATVFSVCQWNAARMVQVR